VPGVARPKGITKRWAIRDSNGPTSEFPTIHPEARAGTVAGRAFKGKVDCLAPDCNGLRAAFQWEMKCGADEAQPGQVRRVLEPQKPALSEANGGRPNEAQVFEPQRGGPTRPGFLSPKGAK